MKENSNCVLGPKLREGTRLVKQFFFIPDLNQCRQDGGHG